MSVIATFRVQAGDFTLGHSIRGNPGTKITLDRVIPLGDNFIPYFWVADDSLAAIKHDLEAEADIASFDVIDSIDGEALVRVEWDESVDGLLETIVTTRASILEGVGERDMWRLQLRFDDHDQLAQFFRETAKKDISIDLETVFNPAIPRPFTLASKLTEAQRETLQFALEEGYFDVPRRINLMELSEQLGISDSAVSQRLRRGLEHVLQHAGLEHGEDAPEDDIR